MCPIGKNVDSFRGTVVALGVAVCVSGRTVCPPMGTRSTLVRVGNSYGAWCWRHQKKG